MKKVMFVLSVIIILAVCLSACELIVAKVDLTKYNEMISAESGTLNIEIKITMDGETLTNSFDVKNEDGKSVIDYKVETLNKLNLDGENESEYKKVSEGTVEVEGSKITQLDGEKIDINFIQVNNVSFNFNSLYLKNIVINESSIEFDVKNTTAFMGNTSFDGKDMKFVGTFNDDKFESIKITYSTANESQVELNYTFVA